MQTAANRNGTTGAIDLAHLERATFGDRGLARDVLRLFERRCETLLRDIAQAPDFGSRAYAAHTLKGAAKGIGAFQVAEAAEAIEVRSGDQTGAIAHLSAKIAEARTATAELIARD
jgi:HPt (histidine-containing phosphotransfer) domain-containing protein